MKKLFALGLSLALFTFMLAGCGTKKTGNKVEDIKAAGKLVMMTNATFPPYEYLDESGVDGAAGVDIELAQKIAEELGVTLVVKNMNFDLLIEAVKTGKGDIVAAGMTIDEERLESVDFSVPYVDTTLLVIVPPNSDVKGSAPEDLSGLRIAVQESTTSDMFVSDNVEAAEVLRFKNAVDTGIALTTGKADVIVIDEMTGRNIVEANNSAMEILEHPIGQEQYAMAIAKGNEDLKAVLDKVLQKAVDEGEVEALIAKHMEASKEA